MQEALEKASSVEEAPSKAETKPEAESPVEEPIKEPEQAKEELFETPDGRKVNAGQLQKEWRENFLPDYTRKAQELAEIKKTKTDPETKEQTPIWKNPDWVPQTYAEIAEIAKQETLREIEAKAQAAEAQKSEIEKVITDQIAELKKLDSSLSEDLLFQHANKYGFTELKTAYQNMKDMQLAVKKTEEKVVSNIKSRESDNVATNQSAGGKPSGMNYWDISNDRGSAREYLSRVKQ